MSKKVIFMITVILLLFSIAFYLSNNDPAPKFEADLTMFTSEEMSWIEQYPVIQYAPDTDFYPYEYYETDSFAGLSIDYINWIEEHYPLDFEIIHIEPWDKILTALETHEIDLVTSTARTPHRETFILFTSAYISMDNVAFIRSDYDDDFYEFDLIDRKTAVIKGYYTHDFLTLRHPGINLTVVENSNEGFQKLTLGEVDVFIVGSGQALNSINTLHIENVKVNEKIRILTSVPLSMGTHMDNPELQSILTKILQNMPPELHKSLYDKWMNIDFAENLSLEVYKNMLIAALIMAILIFSAFIWNQLLKRQVAVKTEQIITELQHRKSLELQLKNIINAIPSLIYVKNGEGQYLHVNKAFCDHVHISSPEDIELKNNIEFNILKKEDRAQIKENELNVITTQRPLYIRNNAVIFADGSEKIYDSSILPFQLLSDPHEGILSIDIDITDRVKAQDQLKEMNVTLEQKVKTRSEDISLINSELSSSMDRLKTNEHNLRDTNDELTSLLDTLQTTQRQLIEKETMGAQGQNLGQISKEISIPMIRMLDITNTLIQTLNVLYQGIQDNKLTTGEMNQHLSTIETDLNRVFIGLQNASRTVDTFKLISMVDHGLQPTKINLKLMLETCSTQVLDSSVKIHIECPNTLYLTASPNAFHQILTHLILYTSLVQSELHAEIESDLFKMLSYIQNDELYIEFKRKITEFEKNTIHASNTTHDLGLQLIQSIIEHHFGGQLESRIESDFLVTRLVISNLYVLDVTSQTDEEDHI